MDASNLTPDKPDQLSEMAKRLDRLEHQLADLEKTGTKSFDILKWGMGMAKSKPSMESDFARTIKYPSKTCGITDPGNDTIRIRFFFAAA